MVSLRFFEGKENMSSVRERQNIFSKTAMHLLTNLVKDAIIHLTIRLNVK